MYVNQLRRQGLNSFQIGWEKGQPLGMVRSAPRLQSESKAKEAKQHPHLWLCHYSLNKVRCPEIAPMYSVLRYSFVFIHSLMRGWFGGIISSCCFYSECCTNMCRLWMCLWGDGGWEDLAVVRLPSQTHTLIHCGTWFLCRMLPFGIKGCPPVQLTNYITQKHTIKRVSSCWYFLNEHESSNLMFFVSTPPGIKRPPICMWKGRKALYVVWWNRAHRGACNEHAMLIRGTSQPQAARMQN